MDVVEGKCTREIVNVGRTPSAVLQYGAHTVQMRISHDSQVCKLPALVVLVC